MYLSFDMASSVDNRDAIANIMVESIAWMYFLNVIDDTWNTDELVYLRYDLGMHLFLFFPFQIYFCCCW